MIETSIKKIKAAFIHSGWSKNHLAVRAGVSDGSTRNIFERDWEPSVRILKKIEKALVNEGFLLEELKKEEVA